MLSFDTVVIVIHVVATIIGLVVGWGWINGFLCLITNVVVNVGLASAALRGHHSFAIDISFLVLGFCLLFMVRFFHELRSN